VDIDVDVHEESGLSSCVFLLQRCKVLLQGGQVTSFYCTALLDCAAVKISGVR
jgi:hypothetical protein